MDTFNRFYDALDKANRADVAGASELWELFMALSDDAAGDDLLGKLDAYQCDASAEAQALYSHLIKQAYKVVA